MGTTGTLVELKSNHFDLMSRPKYTFTQYRIDFEPQIESSRVRSGIINDQKPTLGGLIYDRGSILHLINPLPDNNTVLNVIIRDGTEVKIKLKKTNVIHATDDLSFQILNTILRRAMGKLNLQLVGRNLYDAVAKKTIDCKIELWPGYITSIGQYEHKILLRCELTHKVMRRETALSILEDLMRSQPRNYKDAFSKEMIGTTVLTDYNNKTYRITDVEYALTPASTFETKQNAEESFISYYERRYKITIHNPKQPMLICKANAKAIRAGQVSLISSLFETEF